MKRIFFILVLSSITTLLSAQIDQTKSWSLNECMLYALEHSPKAKIQEATNDNRRIDHRSAYLDWVPSINASIGAGSNFGRSIDPETNTYTSTASFSNSYGIGASYTIFDGFSVVNNYRITKIAIMSGVHEYEQIKDNLCLEIIQAYFNVLYNMGMVDITKEKLIESQKDLKKGLIQEELGLIGRADVLQMEATLATNDFEHIRQKNLLANQIITLKGRMYYPLAEELKLETNATWSVGNLSGQESSESIFSSAIDYLPNIQIANQNVRTAELEYQTAKLKILPNIYLSAGISTGYSTMINGANPSVSFATQLDTRLGEYVNVGMSIPIFSGLSRHGNRVKMKNALKISQLRRDETLQEVQTAIEKAVQDMEGAAKEYIQAEKGAKAQTIAHRANSKKYDEGLISILDLDISSNQLLVAKAQELNSIFTYLIKRKVVNYYKGTPYISQE